MISYAQALRRARAAKSDWNAEERIFKATITWADAEWEYEVEIENEDMTDSEFEAWVEENAEGFAKEDAAKEGTIFEELLGIDYDYEPIDDDARFEAAYETACEREWECR